MISEEALQEVINSFIITNDDKALKPDTFYDTTVDLTGWENTQSAWENLIQYILLTLEVKMNGVAWLTNCEVKVWEEFNKVTIFVACVMWENDIKVFK